MSRLAREPNRWGRLRGFKRHLDGVDQIKLGQVGRHAIASILKALKHPKLFHTLKLSPHRLARDAGHFGQGGRRQSRLKGLVRKLTRLLPVKLSKASQDECKKDLKSFRVDAFSTA